MSTNQDKLKGAANTTAGTIKKVVGNVTGNEEVKREGETQHAKGELQKGIGHAKDALKQGLHVAGDAIEAAADKAKKAGLGRLGEVLHKAGDEVEHLAD